MQVHFETAMQDELEQKSLGRVQQLGSITRVTKRIGRVSQWFFLRAGRESGHGLYFTPGSSIPAATDLSACFCSEPGIGCSAACGHAGKASRRQGAGMRVQMQPGADACGLLADVRLRQESVTMELEQLRQAAGQRASRQSRRRSAPATSAKSGAREPIVTLAGDLRGSRCFGVLLFSLQKLG